MVRFRMTLQRSTTTVVWLLLGGCSIDGMQQSSPVPPRTAEAVVGRPSSDLGPMGGADGVLRVRIRPAEVMVAATGGGARLTADLEVDSSFVRRGALRYAVETVRSDGTPLMSPMESSNIDLPLDSKQLSIRGALTSPPLATGFYVIRVTAVGSDGVDEEADMDHLYVEVKDGDVTVLDPIEWYDVSGALRAFKSPEP